MLLLCFNSKLGVSRAGIGIGIGITPQCLETRHIDHLEDYIEQS